MWSGELKKTFRLLKTVNFEFSHQEQVEWQPIHDTYEIRSEDAQAKENPRKAEITLAAAFKFILDEIGIILAAHNHRALAEPLERRRIRETHFGPFIV